MILNMIATTVIIRLGRVEDNRKVNMKLSNDKLIKRGIQMLIEKTGIKNSTEAKKLLLKYGSVKKAVENYP